MREKRILSSRFYFSVVHTQNSHRARRRGGSCRHAARPGLHSSLAWEGQLPEPIFFPSHTHLHISRKRRENENLITESVSWNLLFSGIWEILSPWLSFPTISFLFVGEQRLHMYWCSSLPEMERLVTVNYSSSLKTFQYFIIVKIQF